MINELQTKLNKFWKWAGMTREEYSCLPDYGDWESAYPNWNELYRETKCVIRILPTIKESKEIEELITLILEVIAIDNDREIIIKECQKSLSHYQKFYDIAVAHLQPESRRQVAELIGKIGDLSFINYLKSMVNDKVNFVQRSALISIAKISSNEAEEIAFSKIKEKDEYVRLFSLKLLKELSSTRLIKAVEILKNDKSLLIKKEIELII